MVRDSDGEGHLPYTDASGKIDTRRVGGAWAALHGGYRGQKYAGPNKSAAIAKLRKIYKSLGRKPPGEESLLIAPFKSILERLAESFEYQGYGLAESTVIARAALAQPIPEILLTKSAAWFEEWLPAAEALMETEAEDLSDRVGRAAMYSGVFQSGSTPGQWASIVVDGVYPPFAGRPGIVVVRRERVLTTTDGQVMCAEWTLNADGDVEFSNVRDITITAKNFVLRQQENMGEAIVCLDAARRAIDDAEISYLASCIAGTKFVVPAIVLEGRQQPVQIMELTKFLRHEGSLTEGVQDRIELPTILFEASTPKQHAIAKMASRHAAVRAANRRAVKTQTRLIHPVMSPGMKVGGMGERDISALLFDKKIFAAGRAKQWLRSMDFSTEQVDETPDSYIRATQFAKPPFAESRRIPLLYGIDAIVCPRSRR